MKEYILSKERIAYVEKNLKLELALRKYLPFLYRGFKESWVDINEIDLYFADLPKKFDGYRIVQISDIHMGTWMTAQRLSGIVQMVNRQKADMVVFTGDLFSYGVDLWGKITAKILSELKNNDGILHVMGNHDYWNDPEKVRKITQEIGMIELTNEIFPISRQDQRIYFAGTDSAYVDRYDLDPILKKLPEDGFSILLSHEPDTADLSAATGKFALQLSGHSHGGQMILPFFGMPIRVRHAHKYQAGLYKVMDMLLYTNRGLGTSIPPFRINCKPEISILNLRERK